MSHNLKGGYKQRAPYKSTHHRIPEPLKPVVTRLSNAYKELLPQYEDAADDMLINASLRAIAQEDEQEFKAQLETVLGEYERMKLELERMGEEVEKLKGTYNVDNFSKIILDFIAFEKSVFGKYYSQGGKEFNIKTRKWDAFRNLLKFVHSPAKVGDWSIGDTVTFTMPFGGTISGLKILKFHSDRQRCQIAIPPTGSRLWVEFTTLTKE